jgi:hypothetical protein
MSALGQKQAIHAANLLSNRCHVTFSSKRSIGQSEGTTIADFPLSNTSAF